jgi:ACS family tartrate transporter-like MFS transporter
MAGLPASKTKVPIQPAPAEGDAFGSRVMRKVTWRLIPFLFLLYVLAYLDRVNVSYAQLQMKDQLHFDNVVYGRGAGIFFIGYFLFEIPSNLILERTGARRWIARIMITWGVISASMMFVTSWYGFYLCRFLLGLAEAGFFPGMILYLTYWFPAAERARAVARFMTASSVALVLGSPLSGAILRGMDGWAGLRGWQWLFLLEGIPSIVIGLVVLVYLTDRPEVARWLTAAERAWLTERLRRDAKEHGTGHGHTLRQALVSGRVWLLTLPYFCIAICAYGLTLWLPEILKSTSQLNEFQIGLVAAIPYLVAVIAMVLVGAHSDRTGERRWHVAGPAFVGALGFVLAAFLGFPWSVAAFALCALGISSMLGPFWTLPTSFLRGTAAAGGIALINSVGNLGGFVGPSVMGQVRERTQNFAGGLLFLAATLAVAGGAVLCVRERTTERADPHA